MEWLNYHHLLYFWTVAQEGSLTKGSERLHLTPQTVSAQLRTLEDALGEKLFDRSGRQLVLTDTGQLVYRYANEIFALGRELKDTLRGRPTHRSLKLLIGVVDVLPKLVAYKLIQPALSGDDKLRICCEENTGEHLLAKLAIHELDVVLSDSPVPGTSGVRAFNHLLGECGVAFMAAGNTSTKLIKGFPQSLDGAPFLLPLEGTTLRHSLELWFDTLSIRPEVVGEFADNALLKEFGQAGAGVFAVPTVVADDVRRQYKVRKLGEAPEIVERWYAISMERKIHHPAVAAICQAARSDLFV
jgi:LysR family transcriptional activator of nhaA